MRADLQEVYGVRLREWLADRSRWSELLDLIDQLPSHSRLHAAILNDPEQAEALAALPEKPASQWAPPFTEFTLDAQITAMVYDRLGQLIDTVMAVAGSKGRSQPFPRPVTELDRVKERVRREAAEDLISMFGGRGATQTTP